MENTDRLPNDQQEDIEDIGESGSRYAAVINQSDWTVQTILQQIKKGNIELNPSFQRREAWRTDHKSRYIESLIMNVPVPQIVLAERKDKRNKYIVIDGKQRLLALCQFHALSGESGFTPFSLKGLTIMKDFNGLDYRTLSSDVNLESYCDALENSTIRTAVIRNWEDENFLYTVFLRLNTGSVPLSPQELRQALHPGGFVSFVDDYSINSEQLHAVLGLARPDPRMRDAELVIRYFAFRNFLKNYVGNLKPLLDSTAKYFNEIWDDGQSRVQAQINDFEEAIKTAVDIFGERAAFRKWNGERYESALNRAIFDIMMYYFGNEKTRTSINVNRSVSVEELFKKLCTDEIFRVSIEGTTKSIDAIYTRLSMWGQVLDNSGIYVEIPSLVNNKIVYQA